MSLYELVLTKGPEQDKIYRLEHDEVTIGRDRSCQILLKDRTISRYHAKVVRRADEFTIEDLGSANGTLVNGIRVRTSALAVNDRVTLGQIELQLRRAAETPFPGKQTVDPAKYSADTTLLHQPFEKHLSEPNETTSNSLMSITHSLSSNELMNLLGRSHASLSATYRVIQMASSIFDLDVLLNKILDETFSTIAAERAFILLMDPNSDQLEIKASRWQKKEGVEQKVSISQHIIAHVLEKKESVLIADAMADSQFGLAKSVVLHKIRSAMCSPLRGRTRIVGAIHVDTSTSTGEFSQEDLTLLDAIGSAAGIAVENAQLYREKIQNERLAAMGQAISGLSHYIKNILAAMETSQTLMERGIGAEDLGIVRRVWNIFRRSNQRISNLVLDMLAYSKERKPEIQDCLINDICEEAAELCQDRFQAKKAKLELELDPHIPRIQADPQGMHRCLLNLLTNAIDALNEDGGVVKICTRRHGEHHVQIVVEDNGSGIPAKICNRIFDVFFSTKGSQGTGLGLAVTKKIIEEHRGRIEVHSNLGVGTRFSIHLPIAKDSVEGNDQG